MDNRKDPATLRREAEEVVEKVIDLVIEEMTDDRGPLTTQYVIRILERAISTLELHALMRPAKDYK